MKKTFNFLTKVTLLSFLLLSIAPALLPISSDALAALDGETSEDNALTEAMCNAYNIITGTAGKAFAAFAIISVGIGFFTGKVSWGLMIGVAAGIAAMFGAPSIVAVLSSGTAFTCAAA
jgi:type IV secretory pathway VirB2 component (pilin)